MTNNIYERVANELNLDESLVRHTYISYWTVIRNLIQRLPLKNNLSEEEFNSLKTSFNIGGLGKLGVTYDRYMGLKKRMQYTKELRNAKQKSNKTTI